MSGPQEILIIDDEPAIRRFLKSSLVAHDFHVVEAGTGKEGLAALDNSRLALVVVDLGLPDMDGHELIRAIRQRSPVPIVVLSVRDDEAGKVAALDDGADDYVTKPFGIEEFMARVRAALRHRLQQQGQSAHLQVGDISIDVLARDVKRGGQPVKLSRREFDLLVYLAEHAGKVITHQQALTHVWGPGHGEYIEYLRVYVRQLRQKIEADPQRPVLILTVPGVGYRIDPGSGTDAAR
ncbi:response regulator transcription factor [Dongia rigui]|uniref:Response regulator transcription factor n=1 Tax=Dongia rigui TaxID=940149 RepID=A0ABU5E3D9_9PROT|nr:response regulator transcription factor [Dongia rigui]MDY0873695.1 response regulator transcription factor [Dongia rigui]